MLASTVARLQCVALVLFWAADAALAYTNAYGAYASYPNTSAPTVAPSVFCTTEEYQACEGIYPLQDPGTYGLWGVVILIGAVFFVDTSRLRQSQQDVSPADSPALPVSSASFDIGPTSKDGAQAETVGLQAPADAQSDRSAPARPAATARPRVLLWDNAKYVLTHFVVFNHLAEPFEMYKMEPAYTQVPWIEMFLMPTFIFMSGALSSRELNEKRLKGIVKLLAIYFMCNLLFYTLTYFLPKLDANKQAPFVCFDPQHGTLKASCAYSSNHKNVPDFFGQVLWMPYFHLWYMLALPIWRIMDSLFGLMKYPLLYSMIVGMLSHFVNAGDILGFGHTFGMYPFFTLGGELKRLGYLNRLAAFLDRGAVRWIAALFLLALRLAHKFVPLALDDGSWLNDIVGPGSALSYMHLATVSYTFGTPTGAYVNGYWVQDYTAWKAVPLLVLVYALQVTCMLAVLAVIPNTALPCGLTEKGKYTLCNYIMHPISLLLLSYTGVFKSCCGYFGKFYMSQQFVFFLFGLLVTYTLASKRAMKLFGLFLNPPVEYLYEGGPSFPSLRQLTEEQLLRWRQR